jgi:hypothetical protein
MFLFVTTKCPFKTTFFLTKWVCKFNLYWLNLIWLFPCKERFTGIHSLILNNRILLPLLVNLCLTNSNSRWHFSQIPSNPNLGRSLFLSKYRKFIRLILESFNQLWKQLVFFNFQWDFTVLEVILRLIFLVSFEFWCWMFWRYWRSDAHVWIVIFISVFVLHGLLDVAIEVASNLLVSTISYCTFWDEFSNFSILFLTGLLWRYRMNVAHDYIIPKCQLIGWNIHRINQSYMSFSPMLFHFGISFSTHRFQSVFSIIR